MKMFIACAVSFVLMASFAVGQPSGAKGPTQVAQQESFIQVATQQCKDQVEAGWFGPVVAASERKDDKNAKKEFDTKVAECVAPYFAKFESKVTSAPATRMTQK